MTEKLFQKNIDKACIHHTFGNKIGKLEYINKTQWNDYSERKELEDTSNYLSDEIKSDYEYCVVPKYSLCLERGTTRYRFDLTSIGGIISDICINFKFRDISQDISELNNIEIKCFIGSTRIHRISLLINLCFCKILKKKVIEEDDIVCIPLIYTEFQNNKFPLYLLKYHNFVIDVTSDSDNIMDIELSCKKYPKQNKITFAQIPTLEAQTYNGTHQLNEKIVLLFGMICKLIVISFKCDLKEHPNLTKIILSHENLDPIIYNVFDGDIIQTNIHGKPTYIISLVPDMRTKKDIRKMMKKKINGYGAGLFCMSNLTLSFESETLNNINYNVEIVAININLLHFIGGMGGRAFLTRNDDI